MPGAGSRIFVYAFLHHESRVPIDEVGQRFRIADRRRATKNIQKSHEPTVSIKAGSAAHRIRHKQNVATQQKQQSLSLPGSWAKSLIGLCSYVMFILMKRTASKTCLYAFVLRGNASIVVWGVPRLISVPKRGPVQ